VAWKLPISTQALAADLDPNGSVVAIGTSDGLVSIL
jgi:hypothetical protein